MEKPIINTLVLFGVHWNGEDHVMTEFNVLTPLKDVLGVISYVQKVPIIAPTFNGQAVNIYEVTFKIM